MSMREKKSPWGLAMIYVELGICFGFTSCAVTASGVLSKS